MTEKDLFQEFAAAYPAQPATAFWRAIEIAALIERGLPGGIGLDLGCGDGILTRIILDWVGSRRLVGVDVDSLETEAAGRLGIYERVLTASADAIPEPDATFDFVISNSVLEHIPPLDGTIAEVGRLLRPGGRFVFTVPCPMFRENLRGPLIPWIDRAAYLESIDARLAHLNYLSEAQWKALLARHGLVLDVCLGYFSRAETQRWETLSRFTGGLLYAAFGSRKRPIEIQRKLGIRGLQNRWQFPPVVACWLARTLKMPHHSGQVRWDNVQSSCLLIEGHRI